MMKKKMWTLFSRSFRLPYRGAVPCKCGFLEHGVKSVAGCRLQTRSLAYRSSPYSLPGLAVVTLLKSPESAMQTLRSCRLVTERSVPKRPGSPPRHPRSIPLLGPVLENGAIGSSPAPRLG